jgi:hypothetical protein
MSTYLINIGVYYNNASSRNSTLIHAATMGNKKNGLLRIKIFILLYSCMIAPEYSKTE